MTQTMLSMEYGSKFFQHLHQSLVPKYKIVPQEKDFESLSSQLVTSYLRILLDVEKRFPQLDRFVCEEVIIIGKLNTNIPILGKLFKGDINFQNTIIPLNSPLATLLEQKLHILFFAGYHSISMNIMTSSDSSNEAMTVVDETPAIIGSEMQAAS